MITSRMAQMTGLGADWWNDSGVPSELAEAVNLGAVGGTSNPVIVSQAAKNNPALCIPIVERLAAENPESTEDFIAWQLIHTLGVQAAEKLLPIYEASDGQKGYLSIQVNPQSYPSMSRMVEQAVGLARLAPNICIKLPATSVGIHAIEALTSVGISVNATVSFSVAQTLAVSEAIERGRKKAPPKLSRGAPVPAYITIMIGRVDDQLKRVAEDRKLAHTPGLLDWAGIAVFKRARKIMQEQGRQGMLLAAAYRHEGHWSQIIGRDVLQTIPYVWWKRFDTSGWTPRLTIGDPVDPAIVAELSAKFSDFVRAYEPAGMSPGEFVGYGATVHTLDQFLAGYADLLAFVRTSMLRRVAIKT